MHDGFGREHGTCVFARVRTYLALISLSLSSIAIADGSAEAAMRWHTHELTFTDGAETYSETSDVPNAFKDRRLTCRFTAPGGATSYVVQGFYDGDGAGGASGAKFTCRFSFPQTGTWSYQAKLCKGVDAALDPNPNTCALDRTIDVLEPSTGIVNVTQSTAQAPDFRAPQRGWVRNQGSHVLTFEGGGGGLDKRGL